MAQSKEEKAAYLRAWRARNPGREAATARRWQEANPGKRAAATRKWKDLHPEKAKEVRRRSNLKTCYSVTPEWLIETLLKQGGCAICGTAEASQRGGWNVDHDHANGKTRGVLCGHCNRAIGSLKDDPAVCLAAARYLSHYREAHSV